MGNKTTVTHDGNTYEFEVAKERMANDNCMALPFHVECDGEEIGWWVSIHRKDAPKDAPIDRDGVTLVAHCFNKESASMIAAAINIAASLTDAQSKLEDGVKKQQSRYDVPKLHAEIDRMISKGKTEEEIMKSLMERKSEFEVKSEGKSRGEW